MIRKITCLLLVPLLSFSLFSGTIVHANTIPDNPTLSYMLSISKEPTADMYGPSSAGATDSVVHYSRVGISGLGQNFWHTVLTQQGLKDKIYYDAFFNSKEMFDPDNVLSIASDNKYKTQHIMVFGDVVGFSSYLGVTTYQGSKKSCAWDNESETDPSKFLDFNISILKNPDNTKDYTTEFNDMVKSSTKASSTQMDDGGLFCIAPSQIPLDNKWYYNGINQFVKLVSIISLDGYSNIKVYRYMQLDYSKEWYDDNPSQPYDFNGEVEKNDYVYSDPTPDPTPTPTKKVYTSTRIWGQQRMDTAEEIAKNFNSGTVNNVILASAYNYPDSLSGSTLAAKLNAPILLCGNSKSDSGQALEYINNHLAKTGGTVYILGGTGVIGTDLENYLKGLKFNVNRLGGATRYDTNKQIAIAENVKQGTPVMLAYSGNYPDALSASSIAGIKGYPIIFSDTDSLPQQTLGILSIIKPSTVYILGDTGVISDKVKDQIESSLGLSDANIVRMGGATRYDTCMSILKQFNIDTANAIIVSGQNFPDALAGSILGVKLNAPIIITDNNDVSKQKSYLDSTNISNLYALGGSGVISDDTINALKK